MLIMIEYHNSKKKINFNITVNIHGYSTARINANNYEFYVKGTKSSYTFDTNTNSTDTAICPLKLYSLTNANITEPITIPLYLVMVPETFFESTNYTTINDSHVFKRYNFWWCIALDQWKSEGLIDSNGKVTVPINGYTIMSM